MAISRVKVKDCQLWFPDREVAMSVSRVQLDYGLDTIPRALVVPATGRSIATGEVEFNLADLSEQEKAEIYLVFEDGSEKGSQQLLMAGYVQRLGADDNAGFMNSQQTASLVITHNLVALASHPAAGVIYTGEGGNPLITLAAMRATAMMLNSGDTDNPGLFTLAAEYKTASKAISENLPNTPAHLILHIMESLISNFSGTESNAYQVLKFMKAFEGVDLTGLGVEPFTIFSNVLSRFASAWKQGNAWEGLLRASQEMWLHVVPFNNGAYLANPLAIMKAPQKSIAAHEYQMLSRNVTRDLRQPIDGIYLTMSGTNGPVDATRFSSIYPPLNPGEQQVVTEGVQTFPNRYYIQKNLGEKSWLIPYLEAEFGGLSPKDPRGETKVKRSTPSFVQAGKEKDFVNFMQTIGNRVAQYMYGMEILKGKRLQMQLA
ncbi:MAG TPA: hypothetical protein VM537_15470, partial [Anaerolineae bacterium]|nr:hypothetical protein [Anaerolineae bacterium]